jgi:ESF2/ABP1 family protein
MVSDSNISIKRRKFVEGWVEFKDKKIAKRLALTLNNQKIGGKRRSFYHDDLWNIKYLPKFKWNYLTEKFGKLNLNQKDFFSIG